MMRARAYILVMDTSGMRRESSCWGHNHRSVWMEFSEKEEENQAKRQLARAPVSASVQRRKLYLSNGLCPYTVVLTAKTIDLQITVLEH